VSFSRPLWLEGRECRLDLSRPRIMGILNVTPDSFSDGGCFVDVERAVARARQMENDGADLIDIGGESTRPGADVVSVQQEIDRVLPVIERMRREMALPLSIDTTKSAVAAEALRAGANFVNDISGLHFDPDMTGVVAQYRAGVFLMHTRGTPREMQANLDYQDLLSEVCAYLQRGIDLAQAAGVSRQALAVDPGIGFAKSAQANLALLAHLDRFHQLGCPILLGTSRKSFIGQILDRPDPRQRVAGTLATVALGVASGVQIFRVHDVGEARDAALVAWAIREERLN